MKYFVFSDVHGFYSILKEELDKKGFDVNNDNHVLISIGDNFDRGNENYQMYLFIKEMKEKNKIILVKGNHEDLFLEMLYRGNPLRHDLSNGTLGTLEEFYKVFYDDDGYKNLYLFGDIYYKLRDEGILEFMDDMLDYYETEHYVFTHGFIPIAYNIDLEYDPEWRNASKEEFKRCRWVNGMERSIYNNIGINGKKIVVGHFHASYGNVRKREDIFQSTFKLRELEFENYDDMNIYEDNNVIAIDACTVLTKKINLLVIEDEPLKV